MLKKKSHDIFFSATLDNSLLRTLYGGVETYFFRVISNAWFQLTWAGCFHLVHQDLPIQRKLVWHIVLRPSFHMTNFMQPELKRSFTRITAIQNEESNLKTRATWHCHQR